MRNSIKLLALMLVLTISLTNLAIPATAAEIDKETEPCVSIVSAECLYCGSTNTVYSGKEYTPIEPYEHDPSLTVYYVESIYCCNNCLRTFYVYEGTVIK